MMSWLPFPVLSIFIAAVWLLLNQTLALGNVALGICLGLVGGLSLTALDVPGFRLRRPRAALRLSFAVLNDIVRSNIAVARIILGPKAGRVVSGFVNIPLELQAPYGLATLAIIITATPGTLWASFNSTTGLLTIHVLELVDEEAWIATIKQRYERPLMEIFE